MLFAIIETNLTNIARAFVRNRSFVSWEVLKTHLLEAYVENRKVGQWQLELNSCKQNFGEFVLSFANKVENCYIKLINCLDETLTGDSCQV